MSAWREGRQNTLRARNRSSLSTATAFIKRRATYRIVPMVSIVVLGVEELRMSDKHSQNGQKPNACVTTRVIQV